MTTLPRLKARVKVNFPARVSGGAGVSVTKSNGEYTLALGIEELSESATITSGNFDNFWLAAYDDVSETPTKMTLDNLLGAVTIDLPVSDAAFVLEDDSDATKKLQFQLSGITTATTRTLTAPDADTTIVGTDVAQTLTNKTFGSHVIFSINDTYNIGASTDNKPHNIYVSNQVNVGPSAIPAGGTAGVGYRFSATSNFGTFYGSGAPTLSAAKGSIYLRSDGAPRFNTDGSTSWDEIVGVLATQTLLNKTLTSPTLTSPTLTTPNLGVATATSINKVAVTSPATSATLTIPDGVTLTGPAASGTVMTLGNAETVSGVKSFNSSTVLFKGSTSGTTTLNASAAASGVLTLPAVTDTLVTKNSADTLTNKTVDTASNLLKINGNQLTASAGTATVTMPNTTDTLVARNTTDTLTNKTIDTPNITTGFKIAGAAASGNYARGNGTNFVSSAIQAGDIPSIPNTSGSPSATQGAVKVDGTTITASGGVLTAVGAAATTITVGTTTVGSGTSGYLLYNNAGTLGNETIATALGSRATLPTSQTFTSGSGTYTTPANVLWVEVYMWGGGGAGGGTATSTGQLAAGAGGGQGSFCYAVITSPAATYSYAVGAGGTAGTAGNNPGNAGGNTTFSTFSANGGAGGAGGAAGASAMSLAPGAGGAASGGLINISGAPGTYGLALSGFSVVGGNGGGNGGGAGVATGSTAGNSPGGGGSGAAGNNSAALQGGVGGAGRIIVVEHYGS